MLSNDSARAFYGPGHVKAAQELGAIGTLLLTDTVLLVHDVNKVCRSCATTQQPCNILHSVFFVPSIHDWTEGTMYVPSSYEHRREGFYYSREQCLDCTL